MILIADSGSTKCDWKLVAENQPEHVFSTKGYNPFFYTSEQIYEELQPIFKNKDKGVQKVVFYGSGCSDTHLCATVENALARLFPDSAIEVHHDLLGAARATCGNQAGMACIMGTGSNSCLYDGKAVIDNVTNLGYLLGDEGSGSHLGKDLIRAYTYREMPNDLKTLFEQKYLINNPRPLINAIYESDAPNVYLASFSRFYSENKTHPFLQKLVQNAFRIFTQRHLLKYEGCRDLPVHFVGSVAYYFKDILERVLQSSGLQLGMVIKKPIDNLVLYHKMYDPIFDK